MQLFSRLLYPNVFRSTGLHYLHSGVRYDVLRPLQTHPPICCRRKCIFIPRKYDVLAYQSAIHWPRIKDKRAAGDRSSCQLNRHHLLIKLPAIILLALCKGTYNKATISEKKTKNPDNNEHPFPYKGVHLKLQIYIVYKCLVGSWYKADFDISNNIGLTDRNLTP